jgi:hypothetical protein
MLLCEVSLLTKYAGAAIEGLCLTGNRRGDPAVTYTTFYHNVSASQAPNAVDTSGVLVYVLYGGGGLVVPSAMRLSTNPTSNVGIPIFSPGQNEYSTLSFEQSGSMYIEAYQDDTVSPPTNFEKPLKVKNWYLCLTRWSYLYNTLVWKTGLTGQPQNPSCQKVEVERVWL